MSDPAPTQDGPCPTCGGTGKRWRSLSGIDLCDECAWDFFCDLNGRKMLDARATLPPLLVPRRAPRHLMLSQQALRERRFNLRERESDMRGRARVDWKKQLAKLVQPGYNSVCLLCSRIYYGATMDKCSRCGGLCQQVTDHDLGLMGRRATELIEAER